MQTVNPILILVFIPLFTYVVYPLLGRFFEVTPLRKIGIGLFVTGDRIRRFRRWCKQSIDAGGAPHIGWQFLAYALMTAAEVMVSITGLEFSYTQAPRKMKSFVMGVFLLSITLGNLFTAQVNGYIADAKSGREHLPRRRQLLLVLHGVMVVTAVAVRRLVAVLPRPDLYSGRDRTRICPRRRPPRRLTIAGFRA